MRRKLEQNADPDHLPRLQVQSVERCTVHYEDTLNANVDVNIRLHNAVTTIEQATTIAKDLKAILEESDNINKANIYLDLSESIIPATPTTTTTT